MRVNEREWPWQDGLTLAALQATAKPDADVVVLNGFPVDPERRVDTVLQQRDEIVFIRKGEAPAPDELAALMAARHTPGIAAVLRAARVGIAGAGGLGSNVAHALARIGVGHLVIADFDVVEPSNLNRQAYRIDQIGLRKATALADDLARINPNVTVVAHTVRLVPGNIPELFAGCAVVAECFDRPEEKQMLVETVLSHMPEARVVAASGLAGTGDGNCIRVRRVSARLWLVGDGESAATFGRGLMAPRVFIAAGQQANTVVRILLDEVT